MSNGNHLHPLEPSAAAAHELSDHVVDRIVRFVDGLASRTTYGAMSADAIAPLVAELRSPPPEDAGELPELLDTLDRATGSALETAGPGYFGYIPGGGLVTSALGELYARTVNRYGTLAFAAPAMVALEDSVIRWIAQEVCGLPEGSGGLLTTGGSLANFSAVVAARDTLLGEDITTGTVYVTRHTHHSVAKAARLAGIRPAHVRIVPTTPDLRMDVTAAAAAIRADRATGLRPFLVVASAGSTDTGTIDPLPGLAALCRAERVWWHVDAAYGGFFALTERGRERLAGMELADSITVDPHKSLFLGYGTGALVVRDPGRLAAAHEGTADYLSDGAAGGALPDYAHLGPELSREVRGIRLWLPLHLHGVAAFRHALDEKLDLTARVHALLSELPALEVPWPADLSSVAFRVRPHDSGDGAAAAADAATERLLSLINADGRVFLSSTRIDGRHTIRCTILSHRSHHEHVDTAVDVIRKAVTRL